MKRMGPCDLLWSIKYRRDACGLKKDWCFHSPLRASYLQPGRRILWATCYFQCLSFLWVSFLSIPIYSPILKNSKFPYFFSCPSYHLINFLSFHGQIPPFYTQYFTFLTPNHFSTSGSGVSSHHPIRIISCASYQ